MAQAGISEEPSSEPDQENGQCLTLLMGKQGKEEILNQPITVKEFVGFCQRDPKCLFEIIYYMQNGNILQNNDRGDEGDLAAELAEQQLEVQRLRCQISTKDQEAANIMAEHEAQLRTIETDRDRYARRIAELTDRGGDAPRTSKSSKISDPPELDDGKSPRFEDWLMLMKNKLAANADHYSTPQLRKAYIVGRCTGDALKHVSPRMRDGVQNEYTDAGDIFKHLESVYGDPNRIVNAKRRYHSLLMKPGDKFHSFLSEFLYLANEAGIHEDEWKEDLYNKLTFKLQELVISEANRADGTFKEFSDYCSQTSNRLDVIQNRQRNVSRKPAPGNSPVQRQASRQGTPPTIKREGTPTPDRVTEPERERLMKEGKCFTCKKSGHLSRDCLDKVMQLKVLEKDGTMDNKDDSENDEA